MAGLKPSPSILRQSLEVFWQIIDIVCFLYFLFQSHIPYKYMQIRTLYLYRTKNKERILIEDLYKELKQMGVVQSATEFSQNWLGKERSYYNVLLSKRRLPSADAISFCASRLRSEAQSRSYDRQRDDLARLSTICIEALLDRAEHSLRTK
jgi:hypothetical protein